MTEPTAGLTLLALKAENVRRVKLVEIRPTDPTGLVKIAGANKQGKTSTLDTFEMLLGGKNHHPAKPIRAGEKKATASLILQDADGTPTYKISGTWTEKTYELVVERIGQGKVASPQGFLDSLIGSGLGFDPAAFQRLKNKDQVQALLDLVQLPVDPRTLDAERKGAYEERTAVNREVKQLEGQLAALVEPEGEVPDVEVSVAELTEEYQRRMAARQANRIAREAVVNLSREKGYAQLHVEELREQMLDLEEQLRGAHEEVGRIQAAMDAESIKTEALVDPDVDALAEQMRTAEAVNVQVRAKRQRATAVTELDARRATVTQLTASIATIDQRKAELLAQAPFPIPGLGFEEVGGEYSVVYNGIPLADLTGSEPILVCTAIAMAANPTVRVILIRDASLLDEETLIALGLFAHGKGYHILTELVGDGDASSFVIADGGVVSGPGVTVATPEPGAALPW